MGLPPVTGIVQAKRNAITPVTKYLRTMRYAFCALVFVFR